MHHLRKGLLSEKWHLPMKMRPVSATVAASEDSELIVLSRDSLDSLIDQFPLPQEQRY